MSGQSFEFTPGGIRPLEEQTPQPTGVINAADAVASLQAAVAAQEAARSKPGPSPIGKRPTEQPLTRRSFRRELRARLAVVEREIKRLRGLEDEAAELRRLLAALRAPPARVTDITQARKSG
jgi:hypothetical protein